MNPPLLKLQRVRQLLLAARRARVVVIGDAMLDQFIWGSVNRISPEAPVPVVDFGRESFMPGGAANVARNLSALGVRTELFGIVGNDPAANELVRIDIATGAMKPLAAGPGLKEAPFPLAGTEIGYLRRDGAEQGLTYAGGKRGPVHSRSCQTGAFRHCLSALRGLGGAED